MVVKLLKRIFKDPQQSIFLLKMLAFFLIVSPDREKTKQNPSRPLRLCGLRVYFLTARSLHSLKTPRSQREKFAVSGPGLGLRSASYDPTSRQSAVYARLRSRKWLPLFYDRINRIVISCLPANRRIFIRAAELSVRGSIRET